VEQVAPVLGHGTGPHPEIAVGTDRNQVVKWVPSSKSPGFVVGDVPAAGKSVHGRILTDGTGSETVEFEKHQPHQEPAGRTLVRSWTFGQLEKDTVRTISTDKDGKVFEDRGKKGVDEPFGTGRTFVQETLEHVGLLVPYHTSLIAADTFPDSGRRETLEFEVRRRGDRLFRVSLSVLLLLFLFFFREAETGTVRNVWVFFFVWRKGRFLELAFSRFQLFLDSQNVLFIDFSEFGAPQSSSDGINELFLGSVFFLNGRLAVDIRFRGSGHFAFFFFVFFVFNFVWFCLVLFCVNGLVFFFRKEWGWTGG
jgi:hypothetical protein